MLKINLLQVPNQNFKFQIGDELYDITIRTTAKSTFISISRNDVALITSQMLLPNTTIIKYDYLLTNGNFIFQTSNNNLPDYAKFNKTQFLYYATLEELNG